MYPPSHLQSIVHRTLARMHLHFPMHTLWQPQCKRMTHAAEANPYGPEWLPRVIFFPAPIAEIRNILPSQGGLALIKLACSSTRFTCWNSAAWVGGMFSTALLPLVKRWCRASLTPAAAHPLFLYISTTKHSMCCIWSASRQKRAGLCVRATSVLVSSGVVCCLS